MLQRFYGQANFLALVPALSVHRFWLVDIDVTFRSKLLGENNNFPVLLD